MASTCFKAFTFGAFADDDHGNRLRGKKKNKKKNLLIESDYHSSMS